jgi:hypothetical protein
MTARIYRPFTGAVLQYLRDLPAEELLRVAEAIHQLDDAVLNAEVTAALEPLPDPLDAETMREIAAICLRGQR